MKAGPGVKFMWTVVIGVGAILCASLIIFLTVFPPPRKNAQEGVEHGPVADVRWIPGGSKMEAACSVKDSRGQALSGVEVHVMNESGGGIAITDSNGVAVVSLAEPEVTGLRLNGVKILDRPNALRDGSPDVGRGLSIQVVVRDLSLLTNH